jgi:hypothetical protein
MLSTFNQLNMKNKNCKPEGRGAVLTSEMLRDDEQALVPREKTIEDLEISGATAKEDSQDAESQRIGVAGEDSQDAESQRIRGLNARRRSTTRVLQNSLRCLNCVDVETVYLIMRMETRQMMATTIQMMRPMFLP